MYVSCIFLLTGYIDNNLPSKALNLFEQESFELNKVLYVIMFSACASLSNQRAVELGNKLFRQIPTVFKDDIVVKGSLINMLVKFGQIEDAEKIFSETKQRNINLYGSLMNGYNINHQPRKCLSLLSEIDQHQLSLNEALYLILINAASQIGLRSVSLKIADRIPRDIRKSLHIKTGLMNMWACDAFSRDDSNKNFSR